MKRNMIFRVLLIILLISIVALLIYLAFVTTMPELLPLLKNGDEATIEHYLRTNNHITGMICIAVLQMVQIMSVVLSGLPIQIAAGIVYGTWKGFAICHLSTVFASTCMFAFLRKTGEKLDKFLPTNSKKMSKFDFISNSDRPSYTLTISYLMPVIPNGFIPILAAKSSISVKRYAACVYIGSFIPILLMCAIGNKILKGGYIGAAILFAALVVAIVLLYTFKKPVLDFLDNHVGFPKEK